MCQNKKIMDLKQYLGFIAIAGFLCVSASVVTSKIISTPARPIATETYITEGASSLIDMREFIIQKQRQG